MRQSMRAISLWLLAVASAKASFLRDVVRTNEAFDENQIRHALLGKAVPLEEYRIDLRSRGLDLEGDFRELQNNGADDYYTNEAYMNNFTGYSLKYAACQPVQRFSEDAILAGEYSPFVTDDIIILRLCPSSTCNSKRILGCTSKYIDYAISISDYIRIMLRYKMDKAQKLCYWCTSCLEERRMEDAAAGDDAVVAGDDAAQVTDDAGQVAVAADDGVQDAGDDDAAAAAAGDDGGAAGDDGGAAGDDGGAAAAGDDAGDDVTNEEQYSSSCPNFQSLCYPNGVSVCNANGDDATDDSSSSHLATEGYLNYLDCNHIDGYYVRPRCNGYDQSITMGVYYDKFCSQYAGDKVNLNSVLGNLGIEAYAFREFVTINTCIDCAESDSGPYYSANSNMCNRLHSTAASCTTSSMVDVFNYSSYEVDGQCTFLEMVRKGAYDEEGRVYTKRTISRHVTDGQKYGIALSLTLCVALAIYSCYLHQQITNLLVRSITHTDLLTSPFRRRSNKSVSGRRSASASVVDDDDDEDWLQVNKLARKKSARQSRSRSGR